MIKILYEMVFYVDCILMFVKGVIKKLFKRFFSAGMYYLNFNTPENVEKRNERIQEILLLDCGQEWKAYMVLKTFGLDLINPPDIIGAKTVERKYKDGCFKRIK